jgi:REP element-mobilizing transposase RayT
MRQTSFSFMKDYKKEFGGSLLVGKRKERRPLSTKNPIHLILKSCEKGVFAPTNRSLQELIQKTAKKFGIQVYDFAVNWSHIHLVIRIRERRQYVGFVRALNSILASRIKRAKQQLTKVFTLRPFTRILNWGRDFKNVLNYQILNQMEARGFVKRKKKQTSEKMRRNRPA